MNCDIVKDLLPLYIDGCCSEESKSAVEEHMKDCDGCRKLLEDMKAPSGMVAAPEVPATFRKLNDWKASVLQSVLLFLSFALITVGVALEAKTPSGMENGFWAMNLVIPATGFTLSLANWYFVRIYKSRKRFSGFSWIATLAITMCGYVWAGFHYKTDISGFFAARNPAKFLDAVQDVLFLAGLGILLTAVFCVLSKVLSSQYAKMLGKE